MRSSDEKTLELSHNPLAAPKLAALATEARSFPQAITYGAAKTMSSTAQTQAAPANKSKPDTKSMNQLHGARVDSKLNRPRITPSRPSPRKAETAQRQLENKTAAIAKRFSNTSYQYAELTVGVAPWAHFSNVANFTAEHLTQNIMVYRQQVNAVHSAARFVNIKTKAIFTIDNLNIANTFSLSEGYFALKACDKTSARPNSYCLSIYHENDLIRPQAVLQSDGHLNSHFESVVMFPQKQHYAVVDSHACYVVDSETMAMHQVVSDYKATRMSLAVQRDGNLAVLSCYAISTYTLHSSNDNTMTLDLYLMDFKTHNYRKYQSNSCKMPNQFRCTNKTRLKLQSSPTSSNSWLLRVEERNVNYGTFILSAEIDQPQLKVEIPQAQWIDWFADGSTCKKEIAILTTPNRLVRVDASGRSINTTLDEKTMGLDCTGWPDGSVSFFKAKFGLGHQENIVHTTTTLRFHPVKEFIENLEIILPTMPTELILLIAEYFGQENIKIKALMKTPCILQHPLLNELNSLYQKERSKSEGRENYAGCFPFFKEIQKPFTQYQKEQALYLSVIKQLFKIVSDHSDLMKGQLINLLQAQPAAMQKIQKKIPILKDYLELQEVQAPLAPKMSLAS